MLDNNIYNIYLAYFTCFVMSDECIFWKLWWMPLIKHSPSKNSTCIVLNLSLLKHHKIRQIDWINLALNVNSSSFLSCIAFNIALDDLQYECILICNKRYSSTISIWWRTIRYGSRWYCYISIWINYPNCSAIWLAVIIDEMWWIYDAVGVIYCKCSSKTWRWGATEIENIQVS